MVHAIASATGIPKAMNAAGIGDCGCNGRRAALNALVPFADPERKEP